MERHDRPATPANRLLREGRRCRSKWTAPATAEQNISWARTFWQAVAPFSTGVYVNHLDADDNAQRVQSAYGANHARLAALKANYDPTNFFRLNHNIEPSQG